MVPPAILKHTFKEGSCTLRLENSQRKIKSCHFFALLYIRKLPILRKDLIMPSAKWSLSLVISDVFLATVMKENQVQQEKEGQMVSVHMNRVGAQKLFLLPKIDVRILSACMVLCCSFQKRMAASARQSLKMSEFYIAHL